MAKIIPNEEKVFMVSKSTNTTYSGSASLKAMQEWYTMEDVANTVKPYKVYTALLTQSGGSSFIELTSGSLIIGATYFIQLLEGADFSNVGGSNIEGSYFVATGTTPNSWGFGGQLEYNAGAPVATVLENTIGNIWFTYGSVGNYFANLTGAFIETKTFILTPSSGYDSGVLQAGGGDPYFVYRFSNDQCLIGASDNALNYTPIEIRVYN